MICTLDWPFTSPPNEDLDLNFCTQPGEPSVTHPGNGGARTTAGRDSYLFEVV